MRDSENKKVIIIGSGKALPSEVSHRIKESIDSGIEIELRDDLMNLVGMNIPEVRQSLRMMRELSSAPLIQPFIPKDQRGRRVVPVRNSKVNPKIGRNEPCPCGSGAKHKKCCIK